MKGNVIAKRKKDERNRDLCPGTEDPADRRFAEVSGILEQARRQTVRSVNTYMVTAYWLIGWRIVEAEQGGETRAGYGERLMEGLSVRLTKRFGRGFSMPNLRNLRGFYRAFPERRNEIRYTLCSEFRDDVPEAFTTRSVLEFDAPTSIVVRAFQPENVGPMPGEAARYLVNLRPAEQDLRRADELAARARAGQLSAAEHPQGDLHDETSVQIPMPQETPAHPRSIRRPSPANCQDEGVRRADAEGRQLRVRQPLNAVHAWRVATSCRYTIAADGR